VRKGVLSAMAAAREQARRRRSQTAEAEKAFESFLQNVAVPLTKQVATVLKSEGHTFTVFTPEGGLRLASDRGRDDYIEFALDAASDRPQVVGRISRTRGSRTLTDERPVKADTGPDGLTEQDIPHGRPTALARKVARSLTLRSTDVVLFPRGSP
jgi:hypothetical protein